MALSRDRVSIMIADDSRDDRHLMKRAFEEAGVANRLDFVQDGQELLDTLRRAGQPGEAPELPGLILLDLNMPGMDGREALKSIRADPALALIPVLVLSTSNHDQDVLGCYRLGANSVLTKPMGFGEFVGLVSMVKSYWLDHVQLPAQFNT